MEISCQGCKSRAVPAKPHELYDQNQRCDFLLLIWLVMNNAVALQ